MGSGGKDGPMKAKDSLLISLILFEDFDLDSLFCFVLTDCWSREEDVELTKEVAAELT